MKTKVLSLFGNKAVNKELKDRLTKCIVDEENSLEYSNLNKSIVIEYDFLVIRDSVSESRMNLFALAKRYIEYNQNIKILFVLHYEYDDFIMQKLNELDNVIIISDSSIDSIINSINQEIVEPIEEEEEIVFDLSKGIIIESNDKPNKTSDKPSNNQKKRDTFKYDIKKHRIIIHMNTHSLFSTIALKQALKISEKQPVIYIDYDEKNYEILEEVTKTKLIIVTPAERANVSNILELFYMYSENEEYICIVNMPYDASILKMTMVATMYFELLQSDCIVRKIAAETDRYNDEKLFNFLVTYCEDGLYPIKTIEEKLNVKVECIYNTRLEEFEYRKSLIR